ncbi:MAG: UvrD-helicase domain-containing protein [Oscillospiraceae bacterium]|nr:UvrD-helicase domain-containing protein [Oscillospiraceae bacterium]
MAEQLNEMQLAAVDFSHNESAVVTAAAGSGKTTLLVQRVIRLLSDPALGIKADTMAIMTFTRNATNSLRAKLDAALNKRLDELSDNPDSQSERDWLSAQIFALRQAYISTIDAFCQKIIRENPESFDLPINFTIADAPKKTSMRIVAINAAMQDFYNDNADSPFTKDQRETLFFTFNFENDEDLRTAIITTAEALSSYADAEKWIDGAVNTYKDLSSLEKQYLGVYVEAIEFHARKMKYHTDMYEVIIEKLEDFVRETEANGKPDKPLETLKTEVIPYIRDYAEYDKRRLELVTEKYAELKQNPTIDALTDLVVSLRDFEAPPEEVSMRKGKNNPYKSVFSSTKKGFNETVNRILNMAVDGEFERNSFEEQKTAVNVFVKLLRLYRGYYAEIKKSNGSIDFSDCELMLLEKLNNEEFRKQIAGRFSCVIVDEFQDSNDIQAEIFRKIGEGKLFYVGDVKQSIYAFRGANPEIMARLCGGADGFTPLPLNKNYRSRKSVIDIVNCAFSGLMTPEYGGVEYADDTNRLAPGADFPDEGSPKYNNEIHILSYKDNNDGMAQARFVARRIKELHDDPDFLVTKRNKQGDNELVRPTYSDFIILMRTGTHFESYRKALRELGIGAAVPKGKNLLEAEEIRLVLSFLRVVDNPMRNEELLSVMMSPIFRFTPEEMGEIRLGTLGLPEDIPDNTLNKISAAMKKYSLYRCAQLCAEPLEIGKYIEGKDAVIEREKSPKLIRFLEKIRGFRDLKSASSVYRLIRQIYEETDLIYVVAAYEDNAARVANIRQLLEIAADFEERDGGGLSDFLRFLERASESLSGGTVEEASRPEEQSDSVAIMTFHGSKGLEAPVCILAELQSQLNDKDFSKTLLMNRDNYMALKYTDIKKRVKHDTMAYNALKHIIRKKQCGEELRLLYVAMTRAQEKLIMVGKIGKSDLGAEPDGIEPFPEGNFLGSIPFKWVLLQLMSCYDEDSESFNGFPCELSFDEIQNVPPEKLAVEAEEFDISDDEVERLCAIMNRNYEFDADTRQQSKLTVTQLAHMDDKTPVILTTPSFIERSPTGAERGNAYHHCMEFFPIDEIRGADSNDYARIVESSLEEMAEKRLISQRERNIVNIDNIVRFFTGELGQRMLKSGCVRREEPFYAEIGGNALNLDYGGDLSIQGRIDMYFVEDGELVIVDYKSDSVTNLEKEKETYAQQVTIYGQVLPKLKGMPVRAIYLYAFTNGEAIEIQ